MCGRARLASDWSEIKIKLKFDAEAPAPNYAPDWNKPPTRPMLTALRSEDGKRIPPMMRWGLLPHWAKDESCPVQPSTRGRKSSPPNRHSVTPGSADSDAWS